MDQSGNDHLIRSEGAPLNGSPVALSGPANHVNSIDEQPGHEGLPRTNKGYLRGLLFGGGAKNRPRPSERRKMDRATIIGLGDISKGDFGMGCYAVELMAREPLGDEVYPVYLGDDPRFAGGFLYKTKLAVVVGALDLTGVPGRRHEWSHSTFQAHAGWLENDCPWIGYLNEALGRVKLAGGFPKDIHFLWAEPAVREGMVMSETMRRALWRIRRTIQYRLFETGFCSKASLKYRVHYRPDLFSVAV